MFEMEREQFVVLDGYQFFWMPQFETADGELVQFPTGEPAPAKTVIKTEPIRIKGQEHKLARLKPVVVVCPGCGKEFETKHVKLSDVYCPDLRGCGQRGVILKSEYETVKVAQTVATPEAATEESEAAKIVEGKRAEPIMVICDDCGTGFETDVIDLKYAWCNACGRRGAVLPDGEVDPLAGDVEGIGDKDRQDKTVNKGRLGGKGKGKKKK